MNPDPVLEPNWTCYTGAISEGRNIAVELEPTSLKDDIRRAVLYSRQPVFFVYKIPRYQESQVVQRL